ncbi:5-formyltetrahydrofolate cyclo-ligase [Pontimicrobium sp. SW4]|uniref:5-formyltetrahydrofolate cyclo-ligase n=1 Tax=Pontimicrobium sp. SW4 TaxID=3153519 RepID=A0AAU7BT96_9FLAO
MTKKELRKKYKELRNNLSFENIEEKSLAISNQLLTLDIWDKSFYHIFLTIAVHKEINTDYTLNILAGKDKHIVVSKSNFECVNLENYLLTDSTIIKTNHWNIPEPVDGIPIESSKIEVVFVPLLCFDKKGHRVGYGKGFYDNFLSDCNPETIKIGLSLFEVEEAVDDVYEGDIPLNYCVTPEKIYQF